MKGDLRSALVNRRRAEAVQIAGLALQEGVDPVQLLMECRDGIEEVIQQYERRNIYLDTVVAAVDVYKSIRLMLDRTLPSDEPTAIGTIVIGTTRHDIHDQGKNMTADLLEAIGFDVEDLGVDVPPEAFVAAVGRTGATILCLSGVVPGCFESMKDTAAAVRQAGLTPKIVIGGGAANEALRKYVDADAATDDMVEGTRLCLGFAAEARAGERKGAL